ncbi:MAG: aldo/keto reductase [Planctomycetota bacterium]|jgi:aryl-alcohol dehydrogenase-like predicted oxidoreductase
MEKQRNISRREFIKYSASGLAAASAAGLVSSCCPAGKSKCTVSKTGMPMRVLGKTGLEISILSFGAGSQFCANDDGEWEPTIERAIAAGVNFFDTSPGYQWQASMTSEERLGKILPKYRKQIILSTKFDKRNADDAMREFERSLKRMKTDYIDILAVHAYGGKGDLQAMEKGLYKQMVKLKEQGVVGYIGFTGMDTGKACSELMERFDLDVAFLTLNPTMYGDFFNVTVPVARKQNLGIIAFKVVRDIVGKEASAKELLHYCWSQEGVTTALIGHLGMEPLEENLRIAKEFSKTAKLSVDRKELEARLAHMAGPHALCYVRADYNDGMTA